MRIVRTGKKWANRGNGPNTYFTPKSRDKKLSQPEYGIGKDLTPEIIEEVRRKLGIITHNIPL